MKDSNRRILSMNMSAALCVACVSFGACSQSSMMHGVRHEPGVELVDISSVYSSGEEIGQPQMLNPESFEFDTFSLIPHRSEFADVFYDAEGNAQQRAWRYTQLMHAHNWDDHDIIITDVNFSWNGTGIDRIEADGENLAVHSRILPFSIPAGVLVSSHYGDDVTSSFARPDGEIVFDKEGNTTIFRRDTTFASEDRTPHRLDNKHVYTYSLWPYVFSLMDVDPGDTFILPGYELSNDKEYYARVVVYGTTVVTDKHRRSIPALAIRSYAEPTLEEAIALNPNDAHRVVEYYVADEPPYYLGHKRGHIDDNGEFVIERESVLLDFQELTVAPRKHFDELLEMRRKILGENKQEMWWRESGEEEGD